MRFLQEAHSIISTYMDLLYEGLRTTENEISVVFMPRQSIIMGDVNEYKDNGGYLEAYLRFCNASHVPKINLSFPIGGYYEDMESFLGEPSKPTRYYSMDPKGRQEKPEGLFLVGSTRGDYSQVNDLPQRMREFAERYGLLFTGPAYHRYLFDELSIMDPEQYLSQVAVAVTETMRISTTYLRHRHYYKE
jgi:hypothetical protein